MGVLFGNSGASGQPKPVDKPAGVLGLDTHQWNDNSINAAYNSQAKSLSNTAAAFTAANAPAGPSNISKLGSFVADIARAPVREAISLGKSGSTTAGGANKVLQDLRKKPLDQRKADLKNNPGFAQVLKKNGFDINNPSDEQLDKFIKGSAKQDKKQQTFTPSAKLGKVIGNEPITSVQQREADTKKRIEESRFRGASGLLAPVLTGIGSGMNLSPLGAGKVASKVGEKLALETAAKVTGKEASGELARVISPYIHPIDTVTRKGIGLIGKGVKTSVEALPGGKAVTGALNAARDKIATQFIDSNHPLLKIARALDGNKDVEGTGHERDTRTLFGDIAASERRADSRIDSSENVKTYRKAIASMDKNTNKARSDAAAYSDAKRQLQLIEQGRKAGKAADPERVAQLRATTDKLYKQYGENIETARKANISFQKEGTQQLTGIGHDEKQFNDWLQSDPEYQRTQYELPKERLNNPNVKPGTGGNVNISGQKLNKFATGKVIDPFLVGVQRQHQIEKYLATQRYKKHAIELLQKAGVDTKPLKTTQATISKKDAREILKQLRQNGGELDTNKIAGLRDLAKNKDLSAHGMPTITFDENGVRNSYQVPEEIARAVNQTGVKHAPEFLRKVNNVFKYGTTQGNPAFAIPNFLKDQVSSYFNSESASQTHNPLNIAVSLLHTMTGGKYDSSDLYKTFSQGFGESRRVDINRALQKGVRDVNAGVNGERNLAGKVNNLTLRDFGSAPFKANNGLIGKLEETTRFQNYRGTYNLYKRKGYTDAEAKAAATRASRENSTDFNPAGETGRFLNGISPYLNAGIQGARSIGRSLRERPATTSAKLAAVGAPVLALTQWNLGDPQRAATYSQLPDYIKNTNFVITIGDRNFLIPMSQEAQGIAGVYRGIMESHFGKNPTTFIKEAGKFVKNISPVQADSPLDAIGSVLPGPIKTGIELGTNKDFYSGNQIVPDYLKDQNPNPQDQKYPNSSGFSKLLGKVTGASPIQTDYALKNVIGSGGQAAINTLPGNNGARGLGGAVQKRFEYSGGNNVKTQFNDVYYPLKDSTDARRKSIYGLIKSGNLSSATRKADQYNDIIDKAKQKYVSQYGQYAKKDDVDKFDTLKISILTSKKGKKYVRF